MSSLSAALPDNARSLPILKPLDASLGQRLIMLDRPVCVVGARSRVHLPLPSQLVSRAHALLVSDDDGVYVRDLASRNHVFRNGETVRESSLKQADLLRIGPFSFYCQFNFSRKKSEADSRLPPPADLVSERTGDRRRLDERTLLIGQREECDVTARGAGVSSVHAVIFRRRGRHYLRDLNSDAGTRLNGRPIREAELQNGDEIGVGPERFQYLVEEQASEHADLDDLSVVHGAAGEGSAGDLASASALGIEVHDPLSGTMPSFSEIGRLERTDASLDLQESGHFGATQNFGGTQNFSFPAEPPVHSDAGLLEDAEPQDLLPVEQWTPKGDDAADFLTTSGLHELSNANGFVPEVRPPVELSMTDLSAVEFSDAPQSSEHMSAAERSSAGQLDPVIFDHVSHVLDEPAAAEASRSLVEAPAPIVPAESVQAAELSFAAPEELLPEEASSSLQLRNEAADSAVSGHLVLVDEEEPAAGADAAASAGSMVLSLNDSAESNVPMASGSLTALPVVDSEEKLDEAILGHVSHVLDESIAPSPELPPARGQRPASPVKPAAKASAASAFSQAPIGPAARRPQRVPPSPAAPARPKGKRSSPSRPKMASADRGEADAAELFSEDITAGIQAELASPRKAAAPKLPQRVAARPMTSGPEHPSMIAAVQAPEPRGVWGRFRRALGGMFGRRK